MQHNVMISTDIIEYKFHLRQSLKPCSGMVATFRGLCADILTGRELRDQGRVLVLLGRVQGVGGSLISKISQSFETWVRFGVVRRGGMVSILVNSWLSNSQGSHLSLERIIISV